MFYIRIQFQMPLVFERLAKHSNLIASFHVRLYIQNQVSSHLN